MRPLPPNRQGRLDAAFRRAFREDARLKQDSYCVYCEERLRARTATADHVVARATFGLDHRNNIVAACEPCNKLKGKLPEKEFRRRIEQPRSGEPIAYWLAWSRWRVNRRLRRFASNVAVSIW